MSSSTISIYYIYILCLNHSSFCWLYFETWSFMSMKEIRSKTLEKTSSTKQTSLGMLNNCSRELFLVYENILRTA